MLPECPFPLMATSCPWLGATFIYPLPLITWGGPQLCQSTPRSYLISFLSLPTALGAAYGTAKSGTGIAAMSVMRPELIMKSIIPVVMAGIIAIYGLVVAVLIANSLNEHITLYR